MKECFEWKNVLNEEFDKAIISKCDFIIALKIWKHFISSFEDPFLDIINQIFLSNIEICIANIKAIIEEFCITSDGIVKSKETQTEKWQKK